MLQKEEEYEENKMHISGMASSNLELEVPYSEGHRKIRVFQGVKLQMCENGVFLTSVKYTLVCHMHQVSWAARHSTVCFDWFILIIPLMVIPN